tara:strand:- start:746 stop:964 length:219 start_codon:yes stop_codon:yes gene_type:complete
MIRPMTDEERQRAKEKRYMNSNMSTEIALYNAMKKHDLTLAEAIQAMEMFANDKEFQNDLDRFYGNEVFIEE